MDHYTTLEVARMLGLAVRSVQLMVDRGDLQAWKTPGGHRRISRASVERWVDMQQSGSGAGPDGAAVKPLADPERANGGPRMLLIEDSVHYQNLVSLLVKQRFPGVRLRVAADGIAGLAIFGEWRPDILIVDILLPGIDGAALITSLRTHEQFKGCELIVITSLSEADRAPYAFALSDLPVVHKTSLVSDLPPLIQARLAAFAE